MANGSERSGLLRRLKPSIWLDAGAGGEKGVYLILSRTLVLGELKFSCTPSSLGLFLSHTIGPILRLWNSSAPLALFPLQREIARIYSTVHATQGV